MPDVKWSIKGRSFGNCNCDYGCPCQFNALPTKGFCQGLFGLEVDKGHYGETRLDGLRVAGIYSWPGPIHEGNGKSMFIVDRKASEGQRHALARIVTGEDAVPGSSIFQIFSTVTEQVHPPLVASIDFAIDIDGRIARLVIPELIDSRGEPILNPVTGDQFRGRINLPNGMEFTTAEIGRGWTDTFGAIRLKLADSYGQFAELHITESGVVH